MITQQHHDVLAQLDTTNPQSTKQLANTLQWRIVDVFDVLCDLRRFGLVLRDGDGWVRVVRGVG